MDARLLKRPSALIPPVMSLAALAIVISYAVMFGTARQTDEGAAAHLWQSLMLGQVPLVVYFAVRWLPVQPKKALLILGLQVAAALAAMFPVWWFNW